MIIFLRPVTINDSKQIVKWRNTEKVMQHCFTKTPITVESNNKFFADNIVTGKYKQFIVERIEENSGVASYPIATVYLKDIDYGNKRCELCVFTSNDSEWIEESQSIAIKMLIEKAFQEYGMHKIYTYAFYKYNDEIELLKNAGVSVETILKEEVMNKDGFYEDVVRLSIIK